MPALLGLACTSAPALADSLVAPAASTFRDSIGVQFHTDFQGYAYQADTTDRVVGALQALGIRHVEASPLTRSSYHARESAGAVHLRTG